MTHIGTVFSTLFFYLFLRLYTSSASSLLGATLFNFAPYRLVNVYARGALPEFFSSVWIPLILIAVIQFIRTHKPIWLVLLSIFICCLALTHPFLVVIGMFITLPSIFMESLLRPKALFSVIIMLLYIGLGLGLAGYYLVPLFGEMKYFYYGQQTSNFKQDHLLPLHQIFNYRWDYFSHQATRGYTISPGILELIVFVVATIFMITHLPIRARSVLAKAAATPPNIRLFALSFLLVPVCFF